MLHFLKVMRMRNGVAYIIKFMSLASWNHSIVLEFLSRVVCFKLKVMTTKAFIGKCQKTKNLKNVFSKLRPGQTWLSLNWWSGGQKINRVEREVKKVSSRNLSCLSVLHCVQLSRIAAPYLFVLKYQRGLLSVAKVASSVRSNSIGLLTGSGHKNIVMIWCYSLNHISVALII